MCVAWRRPGEVFSVPGDYTPFVTQTRRLAPRVWGTVGFITQLAAGEQFGMGVNSAGKVFSWGAGTNGQVR